MKSLLLLSIVFLLVSCEYRTPSKERFENITGISLPHSITVIEDEFQDHGADYSLSYKVHLNENDCINLMKNIEESENWTKDKSDWIFYKKLDGITYDILFSADEYHFFYFECLI